MYAGGWIAHSKLHLPVLRPIVRKAASKPLVYQPALKLVESPAQNVVPVDVLTSIPELKEQISTPLSDSTIRVDRKISVYWWLLILAISVSFVYNVKQLRDVEYYKSVVDSTQNMLKTVSKKTSTATRAVDPAELRCMSENIYFEAGGESLAGKMAVGHVVLNRVKNPQYPKTVCGVVHQKNGEICMFSWLCEPAKEIKDGHGWRQSQQVAYTLLSRNVEDITEGSTNFHGMSVDPKWNLKPTVKIDGHQFYR